MLDAGSAVGWAGVVIVCGFLIAGGWALTGRGSMPVRVALVVATTIVTFGASLVALGATYESGGGASDGRLGWLAAVDLATVVLVALTVVWVFAMLLSGRRRAERQGRFHPEHRPPFQKPFERHH